MKARYYDIEKHKADEHGGAAARFREFILGSQDGIVNVLGVILGVAAATNDAKIVIIAGLAATFAESISMAAVAYTSTKAEIDYYDSQFKREENEIRINPKDERAEVYEMYYRKGFRGSLLKQIVDKITSNRKNWLDFMMREELNLEEIDKAKPVQDAAIVGVAALVGSFIPLIPFFLMPVPSAMWAAAIISLAALFAVGAAKAKTTVGNPVYAGIEMMLVGGVAAGAGYAIGAFLGVTL